MPPRLPFTMAIARLIPGAVDAAPPRRYRPLVIGPAILQRPPGSPRWLIDLDSDALLRPLAPRRPADLELLTASLARRGVACRVGAAVAGPLDAFPRAIGTPRGSPPRLRLDIYGWGLLYQPPGMRGRAVVDADDRFADLPAVFELPLELIDRAEFLESRGFRTRPLVIPTVPADFQPGPDGRLRNRFFPEAVFRTPCGLDRLL